MPPKYNYARIRELRRMVDDLISRGRKVLVQNVWFNECGTPACLGGHACTWEPFREQGLSDFLGDPYYEQGPRYEFERGEPDAEVRFPRWTTTRPVLYGVDALTEFFGQDTERWWQDIIFNPWGTNRPKLTEVRRTIDQALACAGGGD